MTVPGHPGSHLALPAPLCAWLPLPYLWAQWGQDLSSIRGRFSSSGPLTPTYGVDTVHLLQLWTTDGGEMGSRVGTFRPIFPRARAGQA